MAAVFPLDTTKPWVFNGVTYEYDATEGRWYVISTSATDQVVDELAELSRNLDITNSVIDQEIENRTVLLNAAASKNNAQDSQITELDSRVDALSASVGILEFKGTYTYRLERSEAACDAAYIACLNQAPGDPGNASECNRLYDECKAEVGDPLPTGTFTSVGSVVLADTEELVITNTSKDGKTFDWENLLETGDYIEMFEKTQGDVVMYEVVADPIRNADEERIRVKFIKYTGTGDGQFNLTEDYELRVFKINQGLDLSAADARYVTRPYTVIFSNLAPTEGDAADKVLRNGELWYDTQNLELFVWNNNAWVATAKPPSQDIVISSALDDISRINQEVTGIYQEINTIDSYLQTRKNIYYSDGTPSPGFHPDGSARSFNNGDLWIDSNDLNLKFYTQGVWVNPDRQNDASAEIQAAIDALRTEMQNEMHAPAHLAWKFDSSTTATGPADGYMKRDQNKIWRFSFKTANGIDLGKSLVTDTKTHEWGNQMTIWYKQSSKGWKMKAHYKVGTWRWNYGESGPNHFELHQSGVYGEQLSNGTTYYVQAGGWF